MALVFLSCGQKDAEKALAKEVEKMVKSLGLDCYNADSVHGFDDVMSVTEHLSKADYYLFIDFKRSGDVPLSIFTHQEFALARAWGITEMIAFQEEGLESHGMLRYVLAHPIKFTRDKLIELVKSEIVAKKWNSNHSRNLVVSGVVTEDRLITYRDHTGTNDEKAWKVRLQNRRLGRAANNTVAVLYEITDEVTARRFSPDSSYLKWAGQMGYQRTIFPDSEADLDA